MNRSGEFTIEPKFKKMFRILSKIEPLLLKINIK
ncbi:hypothetical protein ACFTAO_40790 [Paenibacillus rhizoplanae]